jgi:hypothetical protein
LLVTGLAVNEFTLALLLETVTFWDAGTVLLAANVKLSDVGVTESGLIPPAELALN